MGWWPRYPACSCHCLGVSESPPTVPHNNVQSASSHPLLVTLTTQIIISYLVSAGEADFPPVWRVFVLLQGAGRGCGGDLVVLLVASHRNLLSFI